MNGKRILSQYRWLSGTRQKAILRQLFLLFELLLLPLFCCYYYGYGVTIWLGHRHKQQEVGFNFFYSFIYLFSFHCSSFASRKWRQMDQQLCFQGEHIGLAFQLKIFMNKNCDMGKERAIQNPLAVSLEEVTLFFNLCLHEHFIFSVLYCSFPAAYSPLFKCVVSFWEFFFSPLNKYH